MNWHKVSVRVLSVLFLFMLCGAIASHVLWQEAPLKGVGSSSFLFIAGALVMLTAEKRDRMRLAFAGLIGFLAELIGVQYGWLFGQYKYTEVLAPNWMGTPIVMICAWFVLIAYVKEMLLRFRLSVWAEIAFGALWMMVLDLLIDPLAAHPFNFWSWIDTGLYYGIPFRNFVGWYVVSAVIFGLDRWIFRTHFRENYWGRMVGLGIVWLYMICAFDYEYYLAGVVGIGLIVVDALIAGSFLGISALKSLRERMAS